MSAYFIVQINVKNQDNYKEYISKVSPIVEKFGGEYIIRGGKSENVEGSGKSDQSFKRGYKSSG